MMPSLFPFFHRSRYWFTVENFKMFLVFLAVGPLIGLAGVALTAGIHFSETWIHTLYGASPYIFFFTLPAGLPLLLWISDRYFPGVDGSGIPKAVVAYRKANVPTAGPEPTSIWSDMFNGGVFNMLTLKLMLAKYFITLLVIMCGGSMGPEGPMVFIGACIASSLAKYAKLRFNHQKNAIAAGSAAALATAFNSPMGGIAFAIEEISGEYEYFHTRTVIVVLVVLATMTSTSIPGFGNVFLGERLAPFHGTDLLAAPIIGVCLGTMGGLFARAVAEGAKFRKRHPVLAKRYHYPFAAAMGLLVALLGVWTDGMVFGPGESMSNKILNSASDGSIPSDDTLLHLYGIFKLVATLASALTTLTGGLFVPGHSVGIGFGVYMTYLCPWATQETVLVYSMIGYFSGFTQGPFNTALIGVEITAMAVSKVPGALLVGLIASLVSKYVCRFPFYQFMGRIGGQAVPADKQISTL